MLRVLASALCLCTGLSVAVCAQAPAVQAAPPNVSAIADEFCKLNALLDQLPADFGGWRGFCGPDPGSVLAARLALFPQRFGIDPRAAREWAELTARAQRDLDKAGDAGREITGHVRDASAQLDRCVLLRILGRDDEADKLLAGVSLLDEDACLWCTPEARVVWSQRQSERAESKGDDTAALAALHDAVFDLAAVEVPHQDPPQLLPGADLLLARYGLLLLRTQHEDLGLLVLQDLVRTRPDTDGARVAHDELDRRGALAGIEKARFLTTGVTADCSVIAVWYADEPVSMRWIAARLPAHEGESQPRVVAFDPAAFAEARAAFDAVMNKAWLQPEVFAASQALPGGAERYVDSFLGTLDQRERQRVYVMQAADELLRGLHGGGPEYIVPLGRCDGGALCREWRQWRKDTGRHVLAVR
jgi:hypothetical protein